MPIHEVPAHVINKLRCATACSEHGLVHKFAFSSISIHADDQCRIPPWHKYSELYAK